MVFLQYGFSHALSDYYREQMFSDITDICTDSLQYGFSCVHSEYYLQQRISHITDMCMFIHMSCQMTI